ncbi:uncharacterized protein LOC131582238 [Poecile atricapillus]|uniref:uncharacterized protein LOC131582238 n=1 Tax=Poecile atricapillus TaxID=48891 RepID=UPI0027389C60|nr:uncharacterized protein LOC131582238 [Poecile atricapillus]
MEYMKMLVSGGLKTLPDTGDVITETGVDIKNPVRLSRIVGPQDVRKSCEQLFRSSSLAKNVPLSLVHRKLRDYWDHEMDYLEVLVNGGLKTLPDAGGPPTRTNQNIEDEKSLEASRLLDKMLSDLETRREMKKMALLKAVFPEGNSGTWAASAEGREAMPGTVPGDEGAETASPAAGMEDGLEPLGGSAGVSAERTFPATFLTPERKLGSHRRGPPRGRNKPTEDIKSLETSKHMDVMLSDLDRRRGGCISLSSWGLSLHIWTRCAWHREKGSMAAWLPHCCFHGLQGCFPSLAWLQLLPSLCRKAFGISGQGAQTAPWPCTL